MSTPVSTSTLAYEVVGHWYPRPDGLGVADVPGVAVDDQDHVYAFSRAPHAPITELDRDGNVLRRFGDDVLVGRPHGITIGPDRAIYAVCDSAHVVTKLGYDGRHIWTLGIPDVPAINWSGEPFYRPTHAAVSPDNAFVFISDGYRNGRVHKYTTDGEYILSWGSPGSEVGQFVLPHGIACDGERVYVADREGHCVHVFDTDGLPLHRWRAFLPSGVAIGPGGDVFVVEFNAANTFTAAFPLLDDRVGFGRRVRAFTADGVDLGSVGGGSAHAAPLFIAPHALAVDSQGSVYVGEVSKNVYKAASGGLDAPADLSCLTKLIRRA